MASGAITLKFSLGVALLQAVWSVVACDVILDDIFHMDCHDRYFMIAVDLSVAGTKPRFDAVDKTGTYTLTKDYDAMCGYAVSLLPLLGLMQLKASYFSCHTDRDDNGFIFKFNFISNHDGKEVVHPLNKTCSPSSPWSPREVTCEGNYMEVLLETEPTCGLEMMNDETAIAAMHSSATSDWQVVLQKGEEQMPAMNISAARSQGYMFDMIDGRVVFRTPYSQPNSVLTEVNGIRVETVSAILLTKRGWVILMVDVTLVCSTYGGQNDDGQMLWKTPETLYPGLYTTKVRAGFNGELMDSSETEKKGYLIETEDDTIQIHIRYDAEGGYRKSFVLGDQNMPGVLYEFYLFHLFMEQVLQDDNHVATVVRFHRSLISPLLPCSIFAQNQTILEEKAFTVYLGDVPEDVTLTGIQLNGHQCDIGCSNATAYNVTEIIHDNGTHGYTLKVPFGVPFVVKQFVFEHSILEYKLDINYTLSVEAQTEAYFHAASIVAVFTQVSLPFYPSSCLDSGILYKHDHSPYDYLWDVLIGGKPLTPELAEERGYSVINDTISMEVEVPLFSPGFTYKEIGLRSFIGALEFIVQDRDTSVVLSSAVKTCSFTANELIVCSTGGTMTVVADVSQAIPHEAMPASTSLVERRCVPKEADETRVLFTFPLSTCGTIVKIGKKNVTYQNEIFYKNSNNGHKLVSANQTERVIVQCTYPLASLQRLFLRHTFESDVVGVGSIIHTQQRTAGLRPPAIRPTIAPKTTPATKKPIAKPVALTPPIQPGRYFPRFSDFASNKIVKKPRSSMKMNAVQV